MPPTIYRDNSHPDRLTVDPLLHRTVAVLGYGNQGHAHALNLRDSGVRVLVGARPNSAAGARAKDAEFEVRAHHEAAAGADLVILAIPDEVQADFYQSELHDSLREGAILGFIHGFAIRFSGLRVRDDLGVVLVAPKGPGTLLRSNFEQSLGLPALFAVEQESSGREAESIGLAWAAGIGCGRAGVIRTTFADETETDLFGEQAVLCGGLSALIMGAYEILVEAGYPEELAYIECCHEVKQVADLVYARGLRGMFEAISNTAEFGAYEAGPKLVDSAMREKLRSILDDIRQGAFADRFGRDTAEGSPWLRQQRERIASHPIESAGRNARSLMPWIAPWPLPDDSTDKQ